MKKGATPTCRPATERNALFMNMLCEKRNRLGWKKGVFLFCLICVLVFWLPMAVRTHAAADTSEYLGDTSGGTIYVVLIHEGTLGDVALISPSGTVYPVRSDTPGMTVQSETGATAVTLSGAEAGDWYIRYSRAEMGESFSFYLVKQVENIWIQSITASQTNPSDNEIDISFLATWNETEGLSYRYYLYLTAEDNTSARVLLKEGYSYTGETYHVSVSLDEYDSYDKYVISLDVEMDVDGMTLYDSYESDPFSFTNTSVISGVRNVEYTVRSAERKITLSWSDYRFDGFIVRLLSQTDELLADFELSGDIREYTLTVPEGQASVKVLLYGKDGSRTSEAVEKSLTPDGGVTLLTPQLTASSQANFDVTLPENTLLSVTVNNVRQSDFRATGGKENIFYSLENGANTVSASYILDGVHYLVEREIFKDGFAPLIDFYEPYANKTFHDGVAVLVGSVEDAVSFTVNGAAIPIENGAFQYSLSLVGGQNDLLFEAVDAAGNRTVHRMTVYGPMLSVPTGNTFLSFWLFLIIGVLFAIGFVIFAAQLAGRKDTLKTFSFVPFIVFFASATAASLAALIFGILQKNRLIVFSESYEYSILASRSLEEAHAVLVDIENMSGAVVRYIVLLAVAAGLLAAAVTAHIILTHRKKKTDPSYNDKKKRQNKQKSK